MLLGLLGGLAQYGVTKAVVKAPGAILQSNFKRVTADTNGVIAGKTLQEIVAVCGNPNSVSSMPGGGTLCQWIATGYHIALLFDENNVCEGISSEIKV